VSKSSPLYVPPIINVVAAMKVASANNIKVYTVSGEAVRTLPEWLVRQKKRSLRDDPGYSSCLNLNIERILDFRSRVELIQDFEFPEASNRIKISKDGNYAVATGIYLGIKS
jgi:ribosome biogenesis protein ENP2